jgi:hypothetical protein
MGATVIMATRDQKKNVFVKADIEKTVKINGTLEALYLDLGSFKSIRNFVEEVKARKVNPSLCHI